MSDEMIPKSPLQISKLQTETKCYVPHPDLNSL